MISLLKKKLCLEFKLQSYAKFYYEVAQLNNYKVAQILLQNCAGITKLRKVYYTSALNIAIRKAEILPCKGNTKVLIYIVRCNFIFFLLNFLLSYFLIKGPHNSHYLIICFIKEWKMIIKGRRKEYFKKKWFFWFYHSILWTDSFSVATFFI